MKQINYKIVRAQAEDVQVPALAQKHNASYILIEDQYEIGIDL